MGINSAPGSGLGNGPAKKVTRYETYQTRKDGKEVGIRYKNEGLF